MSFITGTEYVVIEITYPHHGVVHFVTDDLNDARAALLQLYEESDQYRGVMLVAKVEDMFRVEPKTKTVSKKSFLEEYGDDI